MSAPREEGTSDGPVEPGAFWSDDWAMKGALKEFYENRRYPSNSASSTEASFLRMGDEDVVEIYRYPSGCE
jgi:hypothetical protein